MSLQVNIDGFNADTIANRLYNNDRIGLSIANEAARLMTQYIPMETGTLAHSHEVKPFEVIYTQPYAHYQFLGKLMVSPSGSPWAKRNEKKHYNGMDLSYATDKNQKAGKRWDSALMADKITELAQAVQKIIEREG